MLLICCCLVLLPAAQHLCAQEEKTSAQGARPAEAQAKEEPKVTGSASTTFLTQYIWRGYEYGKESLVIQPYLGASYKGFSASFWGNIDTDEHATQNFVPDRPGRKSFNEVDMTLSYTHSWNSLSLTAGYMYYDTDFAPETEELYIAAGYDIIGKPTFTVYRDIAAYPGWYFNLGLSHSFPVYQEITLDLGASFGFEYGTGSYWKTYRSSTGGYTGSKYSGFHDGMFKAGFTVPVTKQLSIQPFGQYWFPLSNKAKKKVDGNGYNPAGYIRDRVVGGVNVAFTF